MSVAIRQHRARDRTIEYPLSDSVGGRSRPLTLVPDVTPAHALSVSYESGDLAELRRELDVLAEVVERMRRHQVDLSNAVLTDTPDSFSYEAVFAWDEVDVEIVDDNDPVLQFDDDEHLNTWS